MNVNAKAGARPEKLAPATETRMKLSLESTDQIAQIEIDGASLPARIWKGTNERGTECLAFITRLAVPESAPPDAHRQFARELVETPHTKARAKDVGAGSINLTIREIEALRHLITTTGIFTSGLAHGEWEALASRLAYAGPIDMRLVI